MLEPRKFSEKFPDTVLDCFSYDPRKGYIIRLSVTAIVNHFVSLGKSTWDQLRG